MTPEQIDKMQDDKHLLGHEFWLSEICLQLSCIRRELSEIHKLAKAEHKPAHPKKKLRVFYAVEHVPSLPVQIDSISRDVPKVSSYHVTKGYTKGEALKALIEKLTKERQEAVPQNPD